MKGGPAALLTGFLDVQIYSHGRQLQHVCSMWTNTVTLRYPTVETSPRATESIARVVMSLLTIIGSETDSTAGALEPGGTT